MVDEQVRHVDLLEALAGGHHTRVMLEDCVIRCVYGEELVDSQLLPKGPPEERPEERPLEEPLEAIGELDLRPAAQADERSDDPLKDDELLR